MLPICFDEGRHESCSVWVRVSQGELANSSSIAFATSRRRRRDAMRTMYQPTLPLPGGRLLLQVVPAEPELRGSSLGRVPCRCRETLNSQSPGR